VDLTAAVTLGPRGFRGLLVGSDCFVAKLRRLLVMGRTTRGCRSWFR